MKFCEKCFKDSEIKLIIENAPNKEKGKCDLCGSEDVFVFDIDKAETLKSYMETLLDVYVPISKLEYKKNTSKCDLLKNRLHNEWNIFNIPSDKIYEFLVDLLPEKYKNEKELFEEQVDIAAIYDKKRIKDLSILGEYQWEDFVYEIKEKNRFNTNIINKNNLKKCMEYTLKTYKKNHIFFRARIWTEGKKYDKENMGPPPSQKATAGRANPEGISCFYLGDSIDTVLHETRIGLNDSVTVAEFKLLEDAKVVNLANLDKISPFATENVENIDFFAINLHHLKKINEEISRPIRRYDSHLDYIPTQYISEFIKSLGYDGIEYESTMHRKGVNYAFFGSKKFTCVETKNYEIDFLKYDWKKLD